MILVRGVTPIVMNTTPLSPGEHLACSQRPMVLVMQIRKVRTRRDFLGKLHYLAYK